MTPVQQALLAGFNASLSKRGVSVLLQPGGQSLTVLVEATAPQNEKYPVNQATRSASKLVAAREAVEALPVAVGIGSVFLSGDSSKSYRVVSIEDNPISVKVVYTCEASDVPV